MTYITTLLRICHVWNKWFDTLNKICVIEVYDISNPIFIYPHLIEYLLKISIPIFEQYFIGFFDIQEEDWLISGFSRYVQSAHQYLVDVLVLEDVAISTEDKFYAVVGV